MAPGCNINLDPMSWREPRYADTYHLFTMLRICAFIPLVNLPGLPPRTMSQLVMEDEGLSYCPGRSE